MQPPRSVCTKRPRGPLVDCSIAFFMLPDPCSRQAGTSRWFSDTLKSSQFFWILWVDLSGGSIVTFTTRVGGAIAACLANLGVSSPKYMFGEMADLSPLSRDKSAIFVGGR